MTLDKFDQAILEALQQDATVPVAELASRIGLSATPCWRRIQRLEAQGLIRKRVALLDAQRLNVGVTVFVSVRTSHHNVEWLQAFHQLVSSIPEVMEFYRMAGQTDYLLRVVVPDIAAYDRVYKRLINGADLGDVSSSFAMEQIKYTTQLPLGYATA
ncbi:Lrp/AsnC family transcriptional regulator [Polaromonas sp. OV174]|uniref:Lrp/AsnC family transcriptional regulator n=1 Tax=Polaromonas sp. OV174 TaxID=1855300 RepID=UPI0008ECFDD5|nr:Lrp/AsnC family transcriptional regulator [Polaromonas sp. OV174]SFB84251.1 Lrp/AsnC family transcriptional regulator [Polaromonas sp. OV174]